MRSCRSGQGCSGARSRETFREATAGVLQRKTVSESQAMQRLILGKTYPRVLSSESGWAQPARKWPLPRQMAPIDHMLEHVGESRPPSLRTRDTALMSQVGVANQQNAASVAAESAAELPSPKRALPVHRPACVRVGIEQGTPHLISNCTMLARQARRPLEPSWASRCWTRPRSLENDRSEMSAIVTVHTAVLTSHVCTY